MRDHPRFRRIGQRRHVRHRCLARRAGRGGKARARPVLASRPALSSALSPQHASRQPFHVRTRGTSATDATHPPAENGSVLAGYYDTTQEPNAGGAYLDAIECLLFSRVHSASTGMSMAAGNSLVRCFKTAGDFRNSAESSKLLGTAPGTVPLSAATLKQCRGNFTPFLLSGLLTLGAAGGWGCNGAPESQKPDRPRPPVQSVDWQPAPIALPKGVVVDWADQDNQPATAGAEWAGEGSAACSFASISPETPRGCACQRQVPACWTPRRPKLAKTRRPANGRNRLRWSSRWTTRALSCDTRDDQHLYVHEVDDGKLLQTLEPPEDGVMRVCDGRRSQAAGRRWWFRLATDLGHPLRQAAGIRQDPEHGRSGDGAGLFQRLPAVVRGRFEFDKDRGIRVTGALRPRCRSNAPSACR